ncbi:catalytic phage domain protein : Integrase, catalytic core, phage domain protein OS=Rhodopirellula sallentina SM41 GN=RSSM_06627 PE=4 SV=1 [Gemmata massiliana]|uniref:Catalytic phage domain protein: Integrase, catalytic core, phage domain protein n=1 Tax=Gemmata massiliana TaxID=1210884 RepID=A0A6P2DCW9_9BACT|nr:site-specific integrase [Gemmata massiliana]VTR99147.1 catalytic phage domain protein : Integrase, catalytic core, phage domain protein OS=Rhodopirellula sallentina SM41 GN=RSSM_06627 PE=4 SV=1 [Gemmata massiliana]
MPRPRNPVPKYLHHKATGQARVRVAGKDIYLGPYGSPESKKEYDRIRAELESQAPAVAVAAVNTKSRTPKAVTIVDMVSAFWDHAEQHYRDADGKPTTELRWLKESLAEVVTLYGHVPASEFGPLALKAVRDRWVKAGLARTTINSRTNRVRRVFKWATAEELVPVTVYQALATVAGLQKGRTQARETEPVGPVLDLHVAAVLHRLNPTIRAMVLVQRLSGCRPQDVLRMRAGEIDRTAMPWVYRPPKHKTRYRGQQRTVIIGPAAAAILEPILTKLKPEDVVFSPQRVCEKRVTRHTSRAGTRTNSGTRSERRSAPDSVWKLPKCFSVTPRRTSLKCTPNEICRWP